MCIRACPALLWLSLVWTEPGQQPVKSPFKPVICFWINLQRAIGLGEPTRRISRGVSRQKGLFQTPGGSRALQKWGVGGQGDTLRPFKTPYLCEDHLSLRAMAMAKSHAQCKMEGGEWGRYHSNSSCHGNSSDEGKGAGCPSFKETEAPPQVDDVGYSLVICECLA